MPTRVNTFVLMVKEVTGWDNLQTERICDSGTPPYPRKDTFSTFVNHKVYLRKSSGK